VGGAPRRKERERVDVALTGAETDTQMDVGDRVLGFAGRAGLGDGVAFRACAPRRTRNAPRCVSDTLYSANEIVTVVPFMGTEPANVTSPAAGARTAEPPSATSTPRC